MSSIRVVENPAGGVAVEWLQPHDTADRIGWYVERENPGGAVVRVSEQRIEAGLFNPPSYVYRANDVSAPARVGDTVWYRLIAVDPELREWPAPFAAYQVEAQPAVSAPVPEKLSRSQPGRKSAGASPASVGARLRLVVAKDGLYRVTAAQIAAGLAGYDEARAAQAIAQTNLALSCAGQEVAWRAEPAGAALLFFGQAYRDTYADRNVYFLAPGPGVAMETANRTTASATADSWFWDTVRAEQDSYFISYLPGTVNDDFFVWTGQQVTAPTALWQWTTNLTLTDPHPAVKQGTVTAYLVSGYNGTPALDNHTRLIAAGQVLDDCQWAGNLRLAQSGTATNLGGSQVSVTLEARRETNVATTTVLLDALEVRYARRMRAQNDQLLFRPEAGASTLTVRGFSTAAIQVFDVTDPFRPVAVGATVAQEGAADWRASWTANPAAPGRFLAVAATLPPERIAGVAAAGWTGKRMGAAHLVIAPQALAATAAALVEYRCQQGLGSLLVPLEELYDDFACGRPDPRAIPRFLACAATNWTVPPAYVCLAGDGHVDYLDRFKQAASRPNHVPPILDRIYQYTPSSGGIMVTLGVDNPMGDTNGDGKPEVAIGRLPAQTPAALARMIARIAAHESSDAWKSKVLLVSDRDSENAFLQACGRLAQRVPLGMAVQQLYHSYDTPTATMRNSFIEALNAGLPLSVYLGHANNVGLGSAYFFQHSASLSYMPTLTNSWRTPLFLAGACMVNDFAEPHPDSRCVGKGFLDAAPGGAVAVWGSASETTLPMSETAASAIFAGLASNSLLRVGDLLRPVFAYQVRSCAPWLARTSVLMGDPALQLRGAPVVADRTPPALQITKPAVVVPEVVLGDSLDLAGTASDPSGVQRVVVRNNRFAGENLALGTSSWNVNGLALDKGTNLVSAIAYDTQGNAATATLQIVYSDVLPLPLKLNGGGGTGENGWLADGGWSATGGKATATAAAIANAGDVPQAVYQTARNGKTLTYDLNVPDGTYVVRLHFAELNWIRAGCRKFNVSIEGRPALAAFDVCAAAGGKNRAVTRTFDCVEVRGGLQIQGVATVDTAQFNGIEAWPAPPRILAAPAALAVPENGRATVGIKLSDPPVGTVLVVVNRVSGDPDVAISSRNALVFDAGNFGLEQQIELSAKADEDAVNGTAAFLCRADGYADAAVAATELDCDVAPTVRKINAGGRPAAGGWAADAGGASPGGGIGSVRAAIDNAGDVPQAVYQTRRYGKEVAYNLKIPDGQYTVRLHFAEFYATNAGQHAFDVAIEGRTVLTDFDIYAAAGGKNRATVQTFSNVEVRGGLQIQGVGTLGVAQFNGIELWSPQVLASPATVSVPEGSGQGTFGVKLSEAPAGTVTVVVARVAGDADIAVAAGNELVFSPDDYATEQTVVLAAGLDDDAANGTATIRCQAPGYLSGFAGAVEQDRDAAPVDWKINCGGGKVAGGWGADAGGTAVRGGVNSTRVAMANAGAVPPVIYQSRRYGQTLTYNLKIPDGKYAVRLHFAEFSATNAGQHKFDVAIEGQPVLTDFDVFAAAGGKNRATVQAFENVEVRGGLQIRGVGTLGVAQFNGIEIGSTRVLVSPAAVSVPEGCGAAKIGVKLSDAPSGSITVTVARVAGDADIAVVAGSELVFNPDNYATEQTVALAAGLDDDAANGTATIRCRAPGYLSGFAAAVEQDCDAAPVDWKINCGGGKVAGGWGADAGGTAVRGGVNSTRVAMANAGAVPPAIYQSRRYGQTLTYNLKIPDGKYAVRLHFAEFSATNAGQHKFDVAIEGQPVLTDFDVCATAGGKNRATVQAFESVVVRGGLQIQGMGSVGVAQFNGIEVASTRVLVDRPAIAVPEGGKAVFGVKLSDAPAGAVTVAVARVAGDADIAIATGSTLVFNRENYGTEQLVTLTAKADADAANGTATFRCRAPGYISGTIAATEQDPFQKVNCGGGGTADGWTADAGWTAVGGGAAVSSKVAITNCGEVSEAVYQSRRWGRILNYNLSVPDGTYVVRLHFAELAGLRVGQRRFNVSIEGQPVLANFDIMAAAGGKNRATVQTFANIEVRDGLQIQGVALAGTAQFNGIEVLPVPAAGNEERSTPVKLTAPTGTQGARSAVSAKPKVAVAALDPWPVALARGSGSAWIAAPNLADGDTNTLWIGESGATSWSVALDFEESIPLESLDILYDGEPWPTVGVMGTDDLQEWYDLDQLTNRPVACRAVYIYFPGDGTGPAPAIREIQWEGDLSQQP